MPANFCQFVARKPRHEVATAGLPVAITRVGPRPPACFQADLLDLSREGFRLRSGVELAVGESFALELRDEKSGLALTLSGTVRWQQPQPEQIWLLGCQSQQQLDWETLGELFLNEILATSR
jgi:hypothetical protein